MDKKSALGSLAMLSLMIILFTPKDSNLWVTFLILGVILGIGWFFAKKD